MTSCQAGGGSKAERVLSIIRKSKGHGTVAHHNGYRNGAGGQERKDKKGEYKKSKKHKKAGVGLGMRGGGGQSLTQGGQGRGSLGGEWWAMTPEEVSGRGNKNNIIK